MAAHSHKVHHDELPDVSHIHNPGVAHEESDVDTKDIRSFGIWLTIGIFISMALMWFAKEILEDYSESRQPKVSALMKKKGFQLPPEPRLQLAPGHETHPLDDWAKFKSSEDSALAAYGWVDQSTGVARIPVARAKQLLLQQGLEVRPQHQGQELQQYGVLIPNEQSSGTTLHWRDR